MRRLPDSGGRIADRTDAGVLLLEGCRRLCHSPTAGDRARLRSELAARLGNRAGRIIAEAIEDFAASLRQCARCPMRAGPAGALQAGGGDALVLGLVAGLQHGDEDIAVFCASELTCPAQVSDILCAAALLAMALKVGGLTLLPVSIADIGDQFREPADSGKTSYPFYR